MEKILLLGRTIKETGEIRVRFRILDGRKVDMFHKTDIRATADELGKFDKYGKVKCNYLTVKLLSKRPYSKTSKVFCVIC